MPPQFRDGASRGRVIQNCTGIAGSRADSVAISLREKRCYGLSGELWVGDWKYVPKKEDCNDRPNYEIQALFTAPPVPVTSEELVKAVHFYEQLKRENPPASGNQINGLTMSVKRPAN